MFLFQFYLYFFARYIEKNATTITYIIKLGKSIILFLLKSYPLLKNIGCLTNIAPITNIKYNNIAL